jgi:hypothetical protein
LKSQFSPDFDFNLPVRTVVVVAVNGALEGGPPENAKKSYCTCNSERSHFSVLHRKGFQAALQFTKWPVARHLLLGAINYHAASWKNKPRIA